MSQIQYSIKDLDELVAQAQTILVVKSFADAWQTKTIPIQISGKICQPFEFVVHNYQVLRVLRNQAIKAGSMIEVYPAELEACLEMHRQFCLTGRVISPMFARYEPCTYQAEDEMFLVFLSNTRDGQHWSYCCLGAREGLGYEKMVAQQIKRSERVLDYAGFEQLVERLEI